MKKRLIYTSYFIVLFIVLCITYDFHNIIQSKPKGTHTWRQMDGASMALTYYQHDRPFLQPQLHNLLGDDGQAIGEFPIVYYTAGKLYSWFGFNEVWFRLLQLVIYFIGLFSLYKAALLLFDDVFYALLLTLIGMSSPVVNFYALNFMPNVPALMFMYMAVFAFVKWIKSEKYMWIIIAILLSCLAGLLKITALIPLCVLFGVFFLNQLIRKQKIDFFNKNRIWVIFLSIFPFIVFAIWLMYSHYYQNIHSNNYFSLDWDPFWIEDAETNQFIFQRLTQNWGWFPEFYWKVSIYFSLILFVVLLLSKKVKPILKSALVIYLIGVLSFTALYFSALKDHDYYTINLMPFFVFIYFVAIYSFKDLAFMKNKIWIVLLLVFAFFNVQHNDKRMHYRYQGVHNEYSAPFYKITESYLQDLGIQKDDRILYHGEESYCTAFYLLNRYGWSYAYQNFNTIEDIEQFKSMGAKYLFVSGKENADKPLYKHFELINIFEDKVFIFKL